jgi:hypothetical protein
MRDTSFNFHVAHGEREPVSQAVRFFSADHPQVAARDYGAPPGGGNQGCGVRGGVKKRGHAQDSNQESLAPGADALSSCARPSQVKLRDISCSFHVAHIH